VICRYECTVMHAEGISLSDSGHIVSYIQRVCLFKRPQQTGIYNICYWCGQCSKQKVCPSISGTLQLYDAATFACCCFCMLLPLHVLCPLHGLLPLHAAAGDAFAYCCCICFCMLLLLPLHAAAFACSVATAWADAFAYAVADVFACCYCLCMLPHLQVFLSLHVLLFCMLLMLLLLPLFVVAAAAAAFTCCCN